MSRTIEKPVSGRSTAMDELTRIGSQLFSLSVDGALDFIKQATQIYSSSLPKWQTLQFRKLCEIPESECPPRCVCRIAWEACRGERLQCTLRITNTAAKARIFKLTALPFQGAGGALGTISLSPPSLNLKGGESGVSKASLNVPSDIMPGRYDTEILVEGAYEQCIEVTLRVREDQHCVCEVSQGEIPTRVRAHHWYDHFQCVESCFEPSKPEDRRR